MARGGLGARKSLEERIARSKRYHLIGVKAGSPVAEVNNQLRKWEWGYRTGYILRNSGSIVTVKWEDEEEFAIYAGEDARYKVDTHLWRIGEAPQQSPLTALTSGGASDSIMPSPQGDEPLTKEHTMADLAVENIKKLTVAGLRKLAAEHLEEDEYKGLKKAELQKLLIEYSESLDEEEDDDEELEDDEESADSPDEADDEGMDTLEAAAALLTEPTPEPEHKERETYTAKQVATRIGTDAKTLRKFFRSPASTFEPVGQGGRYEFDAADLPGIKAEFEEWNSKKVTRTTKKREKPEPVREIVEEEEDDIELDDDPEANFEDDDIELDDELDLEDED